MVRYEIKKIFCKTGSKVTVLLLILVLILACYFAFTVDYVNKEGATETGIRAAGKLRAEVKPWAGLLDEEKIRQVIAENLRIKSTPEAQSRDITQNDIAYSWGQGIAGIRDLLNASYADGFREYDYYKADSLSVDDAVNFYPNRPKLLKEWLESDEITDQFSDGEKQYLIQQYESIDTPFKYDYMMGWKQLCKYSSLITMLCSLLLAYLLAGIFSNEFQWKADSVFFTTVYGRNKAVSAKIKAGFLLITGIYWIIVLLFTVIVLLCLGTDGAFCPVQAYWGSWKCLYNITNWQKYVLIIIGGYIGCLFIGFLTMYASAKSKSSVMAVTVSFILVYIPSLLYNFNEDYVDKILALLPDRLLQIDDAIDLFDLYQIGGHVLGAIPIILVLYSILTIILAPVIYKDYKQK